MQHASAFGRLMILCALLGALSSAVAAAPALAVEARDPWVRETPPGRSVAAGYVTFVNTSAADLVFVGAESDAARVEFHTMATVDGMMRMRRMDALRVPAGGDAALAPGGQHLMLFDVDATRAGTEIMVEFRTESGDRLPVTFTVRKAVRS